MNNTNTHLIKAVKKDAELVHDMNSLIDDRENLHLWWLGQSGFLLQWNGKRVLIDPYLSDSLTTKYAHTDKPHVRMSERVIDPSLLKNINVLTSSHNHTDHLDAETLIPVINNNPAVKFIIPEANRNFVAERVHCNIDFPIGLTDGQSLLVDGIQFHGIPAKHNEIDRDPSGNCRYMGYVLKMGDHTIYHSGDTLWFDEMIDILRPHAVDIALLPINGNNPERKVAGNLDYREAVAVAKEINASYVIPCHYDMFAFNTADVDDFVREATKAGQQYVVLRGGERFTAI